LTRSWSRSAGSAVGMSRETCYQTARMKDHSSGPITVWADLPKEELEHPPEDPVLLKPHNKRHEFLLSRAGEKKDSETKCCSLITHPGWKEDI